MDKTQVTIKVWKSTRKKLRQLYGELEEPMVVILDRLLDQELNRLQEIKNDPTC